MYDTENTPVFGTSSRNMCCSSVPNLAVGRLLWRGRGTPGNSTTKRPSLDSNAFHGSSSAAAVEATPATNRKIHGLRWLMLIWTPGSQVDSNVQLPGKLQGF